MANAKTIARIQKIIWVLIFIGMFTVALGIATHSRSPAMAWTLGLTGAAMVTAGVALIWVRSRMQID